MAPRVSIVTRTKDRPLFLSRAINSITSQTFEDWELIIVNDGGDPSVVDRVISPLPSVARQRVRIINHQTARGRWQAANAGVRAATGEFLILHDDDDSWSSTFLDEAVSYLDENVDREGVVSRIEIIWEERQGDTIAELNREAFLPDSVAPLLMNQQRFNQFVPIAFLYRRSLHDQLGPYDETLPVVGDWVFNTRVLERGPLAYLSDAPQVFWHQRPTSVGVDGNSVIAARDQHQLHDALLRDQEFRNLVAREGSAAALYLEARLRDTEELFRREISRLRDDIANHPLRRVARQARQVLRRNRRSRGGRIP
ncbi:MAG: glycosyltransferase [Microbacterium sp.]